eukprot:1364898-Pyramimonas_sp.AAC.1
MSTPCTALDTKGIVADLSAPGWRQVERLRALLGSTGDGVELASMPAMPHPLDPSVQLRGVVPEESS